MESLRESFDVTQGFGTTGSQEIAMPSIELAAGTTAGKAAENCGRSTTDEVLVEVAT